METVYLSTILALTRRVVSGTRCGVNSAILTVNWLPLSASINSQSFEVFLTSHYVLVIQKWLTTALTRVVLHDNYRL